MTRSLLSVAVAFLAASTVCFAGGTAEAGSARVSVVVSAQVVDACSTTLDGTASHGTPAMLRTTCSSGAATASVGADGAVAPSSRGRLPLHVSTHRTTATSSTPSWLVVSLDY